MVENNLICKYVSTVVAYLSNKLNIHKTNFEQYIVNIKQKMLKNI